LVLIKIISDVTVMHRYFIDFEEVVSFKMDMFEYYDLKSYLLDVLKAV